LHADGFRWSELLGHLAARYCEVVSGTPADPADLLHPCERSVMTAKGMAHHLG